MAPIPVQSKGTTIFFYLVDSPFLEGKKVTYGEKIERGVTANQTQQHLAVGTFL